MSTPPRRKAPLAPFLKSWRHRDDDIIAGHVIPTHLDRMRGHSPFRDSLDADLATMLRMEIDRDDLHAETLALLQHALDVPTLKSIRAAIDGLPTFDLRSSLLWHAALRGDDAAGLEWLTDALARDRRDNQIERAMRLSVAFGFQRYPLDGTWTGGDFALLRGMGLGMLHTMSEITENFDDAESSLLADEDEAAAEAAKADPLAAALAEIASMPADALQTVVDEAEQSSRFVGKRVVKTMPIPKAMDIVLDQEALKKASKGSSRKDAITQLGQVAHAKVPLVGTDRIARARIDLHAAFPHLHAEIDLLLGMQSAREFVQWRVLLVGEPGGGKTTFARALATAMGVPEMTYSCGGTADAAFGGTSAQWTNSRPNIPLQWISASKVANPVITLDEVDKIATSRHNGNLSDVLLGFLEPTSAKSYYDIALETSVDLSAVSYIGTANTLEDVSKPLRDRLRIVRIPEPTWEHIGPLSRRILDDIARDRGLDPRWIEPLAGDELDMIKQAWPGGSIRRLTSILTTIVNGRDAYMGRA